MEILVHSAVKTVCPALVYLTAAHVLEDLSQLHFLSEDRALWLARKSVVMEPDSLKNVMMATRTIMTAAMSFVKSNQAGTAMVEVPLRKISVPRASHKELC